MTIELALEILRYAIKYGPEAGRAIAKVFTKKEVSHEELDAAFALAELSYDEIIHPTVPAPPV